MGKNVFVWLHRPSRIFYGDLPFVYRTSSPLRKGRSGVLPSPYLETMAPHDAAVVYFLSYVISAYVSHMENVTELLTHVQTVDTRCSSPLTKHLGTRLGRPVPQFSLAGSFPI